MWWPARTKPCSLKLRRHHSHYRKIKAEYGSGPSEGDRHSDGLDREDVRQAIPVVASHRQSSQKDGSLCAAYFFSSTVAGAGVTTGATTAGASTTGTMASLSTDGITLSSCIGSPLLNWNSMSVDTEQCRNCRESRGKSEGRLEQYQCQRGLTLGRFPQVCLRRHGHSSAISACGITDHTLQCVARSSLNFSKLERPAILKNYEGSPSRTLYGPIAATVQAIVGRGHLLLSVAS
jgi:hypothetical protein